MVLFSLNFAFAENLEDNSIEKELEKTQQKAEKADLDINLKSFKSCENMEKVLENYFQTYWEKNKESYRKHYWKTSPQLNATMDMAETKKETSNSIASNKLSWISDWDYSKTNTQVKWVDESDIVKTDGKYIYYFSNKTRMELSSRQKNNKYIYIVSTKNKKLVKKIKVPDTFHDVELYLNNGKLIVSASWYSRWDYRWYYINRHQKTYTIVYNVANIPNLKLEKIYMIDWYLSKSRMIWDYVYVVSQNYFDIPFHDFKKADDIQIKADKIIPKKIDLSYTKNKAKQNFKKFPFHLSTGKVASCNEIEYILPDEKSMEKYDFSPSYNIISVINTKNPEQEVQTKVLTTDNAEMYMSTKNMYLTSYLYNDTRFSCPANTDCFMPYYNKGTNTLIHKFGINSSKIDYKKSTLVPGVPLTQYSMDEYKGNFRILTQTDNWDSWERKKFTGLYILDKDLKLAGKLENLGNNENFKSSRYIGDKLFMVTFRDVDPFFVIDVADPKNPKVLGELKIPGYSTYLHPYDENHIIWLWYDTFQNKWGGTQNAGLKLDLYEINYDKKCGDSNLTDTEKAKCEKWDYKWIIAKQKFSKVFGGKWSESEALHNPRMFMWNAGKEKLFLPVTLRDYDDDYNPKDFFQGMIAFNVNKNSGIREDYRVTNIDLEEVEKIRLEKCKPYIWKKDQKVCKKLLNGETYCYEKKTKKPPKYCFADANVWSYFDEYSWDFRDDFIKRALWIANDVFTISDNKVKALELKTGKEKYEVEMN